MTRRIEWLGTHELETASKLECGYVDADNNFPLKACLDELARRTRQHIINQQNKQKRIVSVRGPH